MSVIFLSADQVVSLHHKALAMTGGPNGLRSPPSLDSAVALARQRFAGVSLYPSIWEKTSVLFHGLLRNHPFVDGNKRAAWLAAVTFLAVNSHRQESLIHHVAGLEPAEVEEFVVDVIRGNVTGPQIANWFELTFGSFVTE